MAVYLIGFALSVGLIAFGEKRRRPLFLGLSVAALLIPCLIAALRAQTVGTDVMVYVKPLTHSALMADSLKDYFNTYWFSVWHNIYVKDFEVGFSLLVYVVAKVTKSLGGVLFVLQALTVVPLYVALSRHRRQLPLWLGMLVYYLLFFNASLNIMRQWIAMAFLLLSLETLQDRKWGWTVALCLAAVTIHSSSLLIVPIYLIYWLLIQSRRAQLVHERFAVRGSTVVAVLLFFASILIILNLDLMVKLLSATGFDRFKNYLEGEPLKLMVNQILLRVPLVALFLFCWKDMCRHTKAAPFFFTMLLMDIVAFQLVSVDVIAIRIGYYFSAFSVLWLPRLAACQSKGLKRTVTVIAIIGYCLFYWYYFYVFSLRHETYPYAFAGT